MVIGRIARGRRYLLVILLCLGLLGTISACATAGSAKPPMPPTPPTISPATRILDQAKSAGLTDATFTIQFTQTSQGVTAYGTGSGKLTTSPLRFSSTYSLTNGTLVTEQMIDVSTNTTYLKYDQPPEMATAKYDKEAGTEGLPDIQRALVYYHLTTVTLVGTERINGESVWHLHGTFPHEVVQGTDEAEVYLRQDTYMPVKVEIRSTRLSQTDMIFTFTAINTGISIALPTPDQISTS